MNMVLIFVLAVLAITTFVGYKRGILKTVLSILSIVITLVAVFVLTPIMSGILKNNTTVSEKINQIVEEKIITEEAFGNLTEEQIIDKLELPEAIKEVILENNTAKNLAEKGLSSFREYLIASVSDIVFNAIIFVISFVIIFIAIKILFAALNLVTKLPVIHQANTFLGLAFGLCEGLIIVWLFFVAVTMVGGSDMAKNIFEQVNDSAILTFLYKNNLIVKYILKIS